MGVQLELGQIYLWDPCLSCSKICWLSEIKAMTSAKAWLTYLFSAKKMSIKPCNKFYPNDKFTKNNIS